MKKIERCYNCGKELKEGQSTKEHIPAKTMFKGYDSNYKANRITVPSCFDCNNEYSRVDEEFRNMIGIKARRKENDIITEKSVKSILRKDPCKSRLRYDMEGNVYGVEFNEKDIIDYHVKNFKGVFYYQYGYPLPDCYDITVNIDENDYSDFTLCTIGYLKELFNWKCSGHEDIFKYCIQPYRLGVINDSKKDLLLEEDEKVIVGGLVYNQEHAALVYAVRKDYLTEIEKIVTNEVLL